MKKVMKKHFLFLLMLAVTLLAAFTVFVTAYAFRAQEAAMDSMMRSYVLDLSDSVTGSIAGGERGGMMGRGGHGRMMHFRMLSTAPALQNENAGGVLILSREGRVFAASAGAEKLLPLWRDDLPRDEPGEVKDSEGRQFYVVVRELQDGLLVMAAVSRTHLLGPAIGLWRFWMSSALTTSVAVLLGMLALWRYLVVPLRRVVESIRNMRWGRALPEIPPHPGLFEISALSEVIGKLAGEAVAREELKVRYVSDMVRIQEDSQKRLARELHDGPLQGVVAAIKRIQLAEASPSPENLKTAEAVAQDAAKEIRNYCDELSPSWVKLGLSAAMFENADRLSRAFDVKIEVGGAEETEMGGAVSEEYILALVRILQEAVSNSVRHGEATCIEVALDRGEASGEKGLHFSVRDNGKGFPVHIEDETDYERLRTSGHRGLANINERVQLLRGKMLLESGPGRGCRIDVVFP